MAQKIHNTTVDRDYLPLVRDLVLRVASNLDCSIFLFGSRARGAHRRGSDIDIGFSGLSEPAFLKLRDHMLSELEESVIPHHVDLVNVDLASSDFLKVAMEKVIVWKQNSNVN